MNERSRGRHDLVMYRELRGPAHSLPGVVGRRRPAPYPRDVPRSAVRTLTSPRMLLLHATGVAAVTVAVLLALWQYDAWQTGRDLAARDLAVARPVPLDRVLGPDDPFPGDQVGRPVELSGVWLPAGALEIADRELDGRSGRWAVTPVAVCEPGRCAAAPAVLVVRGWAPTGRPPPAPPTGRADVTGWLQPGEGWAFPTPTRPTTCSPRCGSPTPCSTSTRTSTAAT